VNLLQHGDAAGKGSRSFRSLLRVNVLAIESALRIQPTANEFSQSRVVSATLRRDETSVAIPRSLEKFSPRNGSRRSRN